MLKAISISAKDKESALRHKEDETEHHNQQEPSGECSKNKCFELVVRFVCEISREPEGSQRNNPQRATSHATQSQHAGRGMSLAGYRGKAHGTEVPTSATARDQKLFSVAGKKMGISSRITPSPPSTCTPLTPACSTRNSFRPGSMAGSKLLRKCDRRWHSRSQTPENVFLNPPENPATCPGLGAVCYFQHFITSFGLQKMKSGECCLTPLCCSLIYLCRCQTPAATNWCGFEARQLAGASTRAGCMGRCCCTLPQFLLPEEKN